MKGGRMRERMMREELKAFRERRKGENERGEE